MLMLAENALIIEKWFLPVFFAFRWLIDFWNVLPKLLLKQALLFKPIIH